MTSSNHRDRIRAYITRYYWLSSFVKFWNYATRVKFVVVQPVYARRWSRHICAHVLLNARIHIFLLGYVCSPRLASVSDSFSNLTKIFLRLCSLRHLRETNVVCIIRFYSSFCPMFFRFTWAFSVDLQRVTRLSLNNRYLVPRAENFASN